jgi:hemolysin activation/secretion protein
MVERRSFLLKGLRKFRGLGLGLRGILPPARRLFLLLLGASAAPSAMVHAQPVPGVPQAPTREEVERAQPRPPAERLPRLSVEGDIERAPCALAGDAFRDIRFTLNAVDFANLQGLAPEALRPAYEGLVGREHPVAVICEIRDHAATILRQAGYVAAVEIPEQRIADGNVRFEVLMARLVAVRVRGDAGRGERTVARYLERLTDQPVFNRFDAERYLLLAGDLPGYDVRLALRSAGAARGEVIGEVTVIHTPGEIDFNVQNFGSSELGRWGGLVRGQLYGLTGLGDRTTVGFYSTADFSEQQTLQLGHDFRVGSEGLTLGGQFTYAWADPDLGNAGLDVKARTLLATAEASYPFLRTQSASARGAAGLDIINQRVSLNGLPLSRDRLRVAFARLDVERTDRMSFGRLPGFTAGEPRWRLAGRMELRQGLGILGASDPCGPGFIRCTAAGAVPPSRLEADPTATVVRLEGHGEYRPLPKLVFALGVRAQYSGNPLLSFEEFSAGNYSVGRGYDPGTLLGDSGAGIQAEIRYGSLAPSGPRDTVVQPYVFFDLARVSNEDAAFAIAGRQRLSSLGGGVRASFRGGAHLDLLLAVPLERAGLQTERGDPRLLLSLTTRLWPWSF